MLQIQIKLINKISELLYSPVVIKLQGDPVIEVSTWMVVWRLLAVALPHETSFCQTGSEHFV